MCDHLCFMRQYHHYYYYHTTGCLMAVKFLILPCPATSAHHHHHRICFKPSTTTHPYPYFRVIRKFVHHIPWPDTWFPADKYRIMLGIMRIKLRGGVGNSFTTSRRLFCSNFLMWPDEKPAEYNIVAVASIVRARKHRHKMVCPCKLSPWSPSLAGATFTTQYRSGLLLWSFANVFLRSQ